MRRSTLGLCLAVALREGCIFGVVYTLVAARIWTDFGCPDFWFRGGYNPQYIPMALGFGIVGLPYGLVLWCAAKLTGRSVNGLVHCASATLLTLFLADMSITHSFERRQISNPALELYGILATSGVVCILIQVPRGSESGGDV